MFRKLAIAIFLAIILWSSFFSSTAFSQLTDSRLNNLESDFNRLESRLNYIELQLGQNRSPRTTIPSQSSRRGRTQTQSERDTPNASRLRSTFDNLATLVIELKQQVNTLEARVKKLEGGRK